MNINLDAELEAALNAEAQRIGIAPEVLVIIALRERFLPSRPSLMPRDEWERRLLGIARNCGVSPPRDAYSREEMYD